jgi:hypothetical protein
MDFFFLIFCVFFLRDGKTKEMGVFNLAAMEARAQPVSSAFRLYPVCKSLQSVSGTTPS